MLLAEQNNAVTYMKCSFNMDDINAVFVAAVRATEKAKQLQAVLANTPQSALDQRPQSALDKLNNFSQAVGLMFSKNILVNSLLL
jgi:hypothetical protein